ncbi:MAG TPA: pilus assembly protein TadG-related protein [Anaerolineaceae bacterium]|nr:pilus assembly protein TadG-related protein [Anaerolineaceae bacterium]
MNQPQPVQKSERGQALILVIVGIVGLLGFAALAIDGGMVLSDRRHAQNAADTASLAGAYQLARITKTPTYNSVSARVAPITSAAVDRAASNDFFDDSDTDITVNYPPTSGIYSGDQEYIQVLITEKVKTSFAHLVFAGDLKTSVEAVARVEPGTIAPLYKGQALVSLSPHNCSQFKAHGNQNTVINGGGIFVNSDQPTCAMTMNGSTGWLVSSDPITVVGGIDDTSHLCKTSTIINGNIVCTEAATLYENIGPTAQQPYPPEVEPPVPTCATQATITGNTLSPGKWTGQFPPNPVTNLQPGVYCVNGDFRINSSQVLNGTGVMIYMVDGGINWNGGATINLTAPTSGVYQGLLIYVDPQGYGPVDSSDTIDLNGGANITFTGTIYAPNSAVNLLGNEDATALHSQVIGNTIEVGGTADLNVAYNEAENALVTYPPEAEVAQ